MWLFLLQLTLTLTSGITFIGRQLVSMFSFQTDCDCECNYKNQTERYTHSTNNYALHLLPATNKIYIISQQQQQVMYIAYLREIS